MGALLVVSATFVINLIVCAMVLGWLSNYFYGVVQQWVLMVAVIQALLASALAWSYYDERMSRAGN